MQVFLIIVTCITCLLFLIVDIYITLIYKHRQQSILNIKNILCLILIMLTLLMIQFQPLFMIVDVINSRTSSTDLTFFWYILYFSIWTNLAILKPFVTSLYESDQDDPLWKKILWIIFQVLISAALFGMFLGIGWLFFGFLDIQFTQNSISSVNSQIITAGQLIDQNFFSSQGSISQAMQIQLTIPCFVLGLLCLLGYFILILCGSCGLSALPLSLILQFVNRPKFRRTSQARQIISSLKSQTVLLISQSDQLKRALTRIQFVDGWWARRNKKQQLEKGLSQIQARFQFHRDYYQLFRMELKMAEVNPLFFVGKFLLGITSLVIAIIFWVQILLAQLVYPNQGSIFLDSFFILLQKKNAGFVGVALLMFICIFIVCATIKGTMFFSSNVPFITIHPMIQGKTWLNSFLFQLSLCVLSSTSLVHLLISSFPYYLRGGQISLLMTSILSGTHFIKFFITNKIFVYGYLVMFFVGGLFVIIKMVCFTKGKTQLLEEIEKKRRKMFGKDNKDKPLHMIQMTEMHLQQKQKNIEKVNERKKNREKQSKKVKLVTA